MCFTDSLHSMELCVGMVCGTVPTLRPLFVSDGKMPESDRGNYRKSGTPIKLSSLEQGRSRSQPKVSSKVMSSSYSTDPYPPSRTESEEQIIMSYDDHQIRRTLSVEVSNDALGGGDEVTKDYKHKWNIM